MQVKPSGLPAGTRPWMSVSGREPGPQSGRGTGVGCGWACAVLATVLLRRPAERQRQPVGDGVRRGGGGGREQGGEHEQGQAHGRNVAAAASVARRFGPRTAATHEFVAFSERFAARWGELVNDLH